MRLPEGIVVDSKETFGMLKFSAMRREVFKRTEDGELTKEVERRTYDLKSLAQKQMIQVNLPAEIAIKDIPYNAEVELVNVVVTTIANVMGNSSATVNWYITADDIIVKQKGRQQATSTTQGANNA